MWLPRELPAGPPEQGILALQGHGSLFQCALPLAFSAGNFFKLCQDQVLPVSVFEVLWICWNEKVSFIVCHLRETHLNGHHHFHRHCQSWESHRPRRQASHGFCLFGNHLHSADRKVNVDDTGSELHNRITLLFGWGHRLHWMFGNIPIMLFTRVSFWRVLSSMEQHKCQLEMEKVTFMTCLGGNMHSFFEKGSRLKNFSFPKLSKTWHGEIKIMLLAGTNLSQSIEGRLVELFCAKVGLSWFDLREYNQTVDVGDLLTRTPSITLRITCK